MAHTRVIEIDDPALVGSRVRSARQAAGLTLRELAFPGCTAPYISAIEHGRRVPSLQILMSLAERLNVKATHLATGRAWTESELADNGELMLRLGEIEEAKALFQELALTSEDQLPMRTLGGLGLCAIHEGSLTEAVELLERARAVDEEAFLDDTTLVEGLGRSYANRGEYESAAALFSSSRGRAERRGEPAAALKMAVLLANTYIDLGDLAHTIETLIPALNEANLLKDGRLRANVYWTQARLHTVEGRHDLAAEFASRALETLRVQEDERAVAFAQQTLAYIELERDNPRAALELLEDARPTIVRSANAVETAVFDLERARALVAVGRRDEAQTILQEIGAVLSGNPRADSGRYLILLGQLYESYGKDNDALAMYGRAIEVMTGPRSPHLARAYRHLAAVLQRQGKTDEAFAALNQALEMQDLSARTSS